MNINTFFQQLCSHPGIHHQITNKTIPLPKITHPFFPYLPPNPIPNPTPKLALLPHFPSPISFPFATLPSPNSCKNCHKRTLFIQKNA